MTGEGCLCLAVLVCCPAAGSREGGGREGGGGCCLATFVLALRNSQLFLHRIATSDTGNSNSGSGFKKSALGEVEMYLFYEIGEKKIAFGHLYDENCCYCPVVLFLGWVTPDDSEMRENVHNPTALLFWARILPDPQKWEMWLFLPCFVTNANDCRVVCFCFSS